jgi:hypothetical protein
VGLLVLGDENVQSQAEARRWVRASKSQYDTISRSTSVDRARKKGVASLLDVDAMIFVSWGGGGEVECRLWDLGLAGGGKIRACR